MLRFDEFFWIWEPNQFQNVTNRGLKLQLVLQDDSSYK